VRFWWQRLAPRRTGEGRSALRQPASDARPTVADAPHHDGDARGALSPASRPQAGRAAPVHPDHGAARFAPAADPDGLPPPSEGLPRIGFVGAGRVGTALGVALRRAGWPVTAVASRERARRDRFLALVPGARGYAEAAAILDDADLVFLTVPDDAVAAVASELRLYSGQAIVHTSGVLPAAVLAPAMAAGTEAGSFHPLVAFADLDAALAALPGATVAIEGDEPLMPLLTDLADALGARAVRVSAAGKALHHAAAVLAAGGFVALLDTLVALGAAAGLDEETSLELYGDLVRQGLANAARLGVRTALTGPLVRGDVGTVRAHLAALRRLAPDAMAVYLALGGRALEIAVARGELTPEQAAALDALLASGG
jgi:predicted short-subunit dehydrogenase-like oxidoreductase (DUF2520 family)